jgi:hypothetical protein
MKIRPLTTVYFALDIAFLDGTGGFQVLNVKIDEPNANALDYFRMGAEIAGMRIPHKVKKACLANGDEVTGIRVLGIYESEKDASQHVAYEATQRKATWKGKPLSFDETEESN